MWNNTKKSMEELKLSDSVFSQWDVRSSLLKSMKTRQTKTWITQNFELVWPIQGRTMWKLTSWGFQKCGTFRVLKVLNQSYWLSKSSENWRKNSKERRRHKKKTRPQFSILSSVTESAWNQPYWAHADSVTDLKIENCGRVFFLWHLISFEFFFQFSLDFDSQ